MEITTVHYVDPSLTTNKIKPDPDPQPDTRHCFSNGITHDGNQKALEPVTKIPTRTTVFAHNLLVSLVLSDKGLNETKRRL